MDDRVDVERHHIGIDHFQKIIFVNIIDEAKINQIFPFIARSQTVNDDNVINAFLVEFPDKSAADKSGATCNDNHLFTPLFHF